PHRVPARGEHDVLGAESAPADFHRTRTGEPAASTHQLDLVAREVALVDAVQLGDVGIAALCQGGPVLAPQVRGEAVASHVAQGIGDAGRVPHDFLGHAADVHARAADDARLHQNRT